jgi:diguanylate cyclase (GGDEF)-like protein
MRRMTGWRFVVYIALPLVLATFGAINLTYDLMRRVEVGGNLVEEKRNQFVIQDVINQQEADLSRLTAENAQWSDAFENTSGVPNLKWFNQTWGHSIGTSVYDTVAILDAETGAILLGRTFTGEKDEDLDTSSDLFGGKSLEDFKPLLDTNNPKRGVASGFVQTNRGPIIVAIAPIQAPSKASLKNGRVLYFARALNQSWLETQVKQLFLESLVFTVDDTATKTRLQLKGLDGQDTISLVWKNFGLGELVKSTVWNKVGFVLSFLVAVLLGVAYVCWKLVQQLSNDQEKSQYDAFHDHLTGLPNRAALSDAMQTLHRARTPYAISFADLDGFKEVNDAYGHEYGDKLIYMVAKGIMKLTSDDVMCSRLGGDEFVVLFKGEQAGQKARNFADNMIAMLKHPFDMEGRLASVGASIGIAETTGEYDVTEMLRRSDIAMYKAKAAGKNRYCVFDDAFDSERNENLSIASELRSILSSRNLDIMFQPVVNARSGEITGVEALARWPSTSTRQIPADKFIGIAENSGLIDALGELILEKACFHATQWPDLRLAVNISAVQLNNPNFIGKALGILERNNIATNRVEFEITETSLIHDTERAKVVFKTLQQRGIKVALDDFGTGFSSIGYLRTFQFDRIKIDKSIVSKVLSSASELAVVQGTLLVARGLSAEVTAEGVETAEEASVLRLAGCTELQGFHYYKPMVASQVSAILQKAKLAKTPRTQISA